MSEAPIRIEGARVALRDIEPDDLDVLAYWLQPEQRWQELDGPMYDQPPPDEIARILNDRRALLRSPRLPRPRAILTIAEGDTDTMLGQVTWSGEVGRTDLNIVIYNPDLWGYGLGYEALGLWTGYLFHELPDRPRLDLATWSGNAGMMRLAHKLGFAEESRERRAAEVGGRRFDGVRFGLDRSEWDRRFPGGFQPSLAGEQ